MYERLTQCTVCMDKIIKTNLIQSEAVKLITTVHLENMKPKTLTTKKQYAFQDYPRAFKNKKESLNFKKIFGNLEF